VAKLEQLLSAVPDPELKAELEAEVASLKGRMRFGLVYERHLPETTIVGDVDGLKVGDHVRPRKEAHNGNDYRVVALSGSKARLIGVSTNGDAIELPLDDLLAVKPFGAPTYLGLASLGSVRRSETRPAHVVINGENYHALQLLTFLYEGQVDCIYIDPPYNTGARDWTYNNRYVDINDTYRHSKWLSMMESA
jgi:adenine-specific DNA-methyltransferase